MLIVVLVKRNPSKQKQNKKQKQKKEHRLTYQGKQLWNILKENSILFFPLCEAVYRAHAYNDTQYCFDLAAVKQKGTKEVVKNTDSVEGMGLCECIRSYEVLKTL